MKTKTADIVLKPLGVSPLAAAIMKAHELLTVSERGGEDAMI